MINVVTLNLLAYLYPTSMVGPDEPLAKDLVDVSDFTEASLRKMGGNGMSLPQAGFVLLMSILCVGNA